jgi:hypothetical protein
MLGCETIVTDASLPYSEKIVISGVLTAGDSLKNIHISRTVAPLDTFSTEKIYVGDAVASITVDGKSYPLELQSLEDIDSLYIQNGLVRSLYHVPNLVVEAGKRYALRVEWHGKVATAETFVPEPIEIISARLVPKEVVETVIYPWGGLSQTRTIYASVEVNLRPRPNETFGIAAYEIYRYEILPSGFRYRFGQNVPSVAILGTPSQNSNLLLQTQTNYGYPLYQTYRLYVGCSSFDAAAQSYFRSLRADMPFGTGTLPSILYGEPGRNPEWNIRGDGIGLFVGRSEMAVVQAK